MPDELTTGTDQGDQGQPVADPGTGTPADGTQDTTGGQSEAGTDGATTDDQQVAGSHTTDAAEFFDPQEFARLTKDLPPELRSQAELLRKGLQGNYTKKTQEIAAARQKIQAFDAFQAHPVEALQRMAGQMGYKLTRAEAAEQVNRMQQDQVGGQNQQWEPKSWDEVLQRATSQARQDIMQSLSPVLGQFVEQRKSSIQSKLNEIDPGWQQHEDRMIENLRLHPTLKNDPATLYRLSVPPEVLESRATQAALKKMETKANSARVGGASTTTKKPAGFVPGQKLSFDEAVAAARQQLAGGQ